MPNTKRMQAGGSSTIGGVIYQMLWCLLRLTRYEVRRIDVAEDSVIDGALLILEPRGGGGDAREVDDLKYTVTQLKARSGGKTWSLQEVIKDVLPDLLKAINLDAVDPIYQFVTDGYRGEWEQVERFFLSLRNRQPGDDPSAQLDNSNGLKIGARLPKGPKSRNTFWTKNTYTERELFGKIVDAMGGSAADPERKELELKIWHLLGHFQFGLPISINDAETEIDQLLSELAERVEDIPNIRRRLLMRLSELARDGNTAIELGSFLHDEGLKAIPRSNVLALQAKSREFSAQMVRRCGFDPSQHVQEAFTEALVACVQEVPIVALVGESGCGKSWHSYALTDALSRRGSLVTYVEVTGSAKNTLDVGLGVLWNSVKGQDGTLPYDRAAKGLPGPPPNRVIIVDRVDDPVIARNLALAGLEELGIRLVMGCSVQAAEGFRSLGNVRSQAIDVPGFSPSELGSYLLSRRVPQSQSIPADVREVLVQPLLARIFCDLAAGENWKPKNEYELINAYWKNRLERNPSVIQTLDLSLLRDLARALLGGELYPWRPALVNEMLKHEGSLARLQKTGWLIIHPAGECSVWHDRLLNWLVADMLVEDLLSERCSADYLSNVISSSFVGELKAGGRWMGFVTMDILWLLAERKAPASVFAAILASLEQTNYSRSLYTEYVPTLGEHAVAGLLARLEQLLDGELSSQAIEIASCLVRIASPEAVVKARGLLMSDSPELHTVALHILRHQGDPASLDRLWSLHIQAASTPNRRVEYEWRMDALGVGIKLRPEWLIGKLEMATRDTQSLTDLVYLLARVPDSGEAWGSLKAHLKHVVPEDKRRCLIRCITVFGDNSEITFVRGERNRDIDLVGDAALAALTRLAPDTAIQDLAVSELRYLAFTRSWHLHRLLAAKPNETQAAVRTLVAPAPSRAQDLYSGAESEIDGESFEDVLDGLETMLAHTLATEKVDPNAGAAYSALTFVEKVCRPDLLERLAARHGTDLEVELAEYLLAIGPRDNVSSRLCEQAAFSTLEFIESEKLPMIIEAGLDADSWYGRIDAAKEAHKHADMAVLTKLRALAGIRDGDDNKKFVAYVATHALCFLEDWEGLLPVVIQSGLAISPYLFEQRTGQPVLTGLHVEGIRTRLSAGELTPGILLAAGLTRDPTFIVPIADAFISGTLGHDETLSAAIALNVLDAKESSVVAALVRHLGDELLRVRFLGFLLAIDTPEALAAVADSLSEHFDSDICSKLGKHKEFEQRASQLAWQNRAIAENTLSYCLVVPLFGHIETLESKAYLEKLAYGVGRSMLGATLQVAGIRGLSVSDSAAAFCAAEHSLRDHFCGEREAMPDILMELDANQAVPVLLEVARTAHDEALELAIADALADADIEAELIAMLDSETDDERRAACILAGRRPKVESFRKLLRVRVLDIEERVATTALQALREQTRAEAVASLVSSAVEASEKERRWVLLERAARHARGRKDTPPVLRSILAPLYEMVTPLEANRFNELMKKGREVYQRGVKDRVQRIARSA